MPPRVSRKKATIWNLVFSYSTIVYAIVSGILLVPIYLRNIPAELYGAWLATGNLLSWLSIVDPGVSVVVSQRCGHAYGANQLKDVATFAISGVAISIVISTLVILIGLSLTPFFGNIVNLKEVSMLDDLKHAFIIALLSTSLMMLSFAFGSINRALQGSFSQGVFVLVGNIGSLIVTFCLLLFGYGLPAIVWGLLFRGVFMLIANMSYCIWRFRTEEIKFSFDFSKIREILGLLSFTSLGKLGSLLVSNTDALLIARFIGPEPVASYVLSRRGMSVAQMILTRMGNAIGPSLSHLSGEGDKVKLQTIVTRLLCINLWMLGLSFSSFLAFNDDFVTLWVGETFFVGKTISNFMCILLFCIVINTLLQTLCVALGDLKRSSIAQITQALLTFSLMVLGMQYFDLLGVVIAPLISFVMIAAWYYPVSLSRLAYLNRRSWQLLLREGIVVIVIVAFLSFCWTNYSINSWHIFLLYVSSITAAYLFLLVPLSSSFRRELLSGFKVLAGRIVPGSFSV